MSKFSRPCISQRVVWVLCMMRLLPLTQFCAICISAKVLKCCNAGTGINLSRINGKKVENQKIVFRVIKLAVKQPSKGAGKKDNMGIFLGHFLGEVYLFQCKRELWAFVSQYGQSSIPNWSHLNAEPTSGSSTIKRRHTSPTLAVLRVPDSDLGYL